MHVSSRRTLFLGLFLLLSGSAGAADSASTWKTGVTAGARTAYDDNVFLQDRHAMSVNPNGVPAEAGSLVYSASLALVATWQPSNALAIDAGYSPELIRYQRFDSENHDDHRFNAGLRGQNNAWSYAATGNLLLVDGSSEAPVFGQTGGAPAMGGEQVRSRRDQMTTKGGANLTYALCPEAFVRAAGDAIFQDFQTTHKPTKGVGSTPGYANYVDRSEWSAGVDAGWFVRKDLALVAGVRLGEQRQANLLGVKDNYSNTLTRFLVGVEGKVRPSLSLKFSGGPDVRRYTDSAAAGFDRTRTTHYAEGSATWTPSSSDALALSMKDYLWLPGGGCGVYEHIVYDLAWKHTFTKTWSTSAGFNYQEGKNQAYVAPAGYRDDSIYTVSGGACYAFNANTKINMAVSREWSDSVIANKPGREYVHWLASAGVKYTF
ncbi:MAG: hypothetical protein WC661_00190 [Opitutaceae bacterium]|jgi:hypothetical protein